MYSEQIYIVAASVCTSNRLVDFDQDRPCPLIGTVIARGLSIDLKCRWPSMSTAGLSSSYGYIFYTTAVNRSCLGSCIFDHQACFLRQEQEKKQRIRGIDAQKANIQSAKAVARILRSSLGPKGMDKMLQSGDGDVCISKLSWLPCHAAVQLE